MDDELATGDQSAYTPPWFDVWEEELLDNGWKVSITPSRPTSIKARMEADHASGARIVITSRPTFDHNTQRRTWRRTRSTRYYLLPAPKGGIQSPWYKLRQSETALAFVREPAKYRPDETAIIATRLPEGLRPPRCDHDKVSYWSREDAEKALIEAKMRRAYGEVHRREARVYQCPDDPRVWHLTSRGPGSRKKKSR